MRRATADAVDAENLAAQHADHGASQIDTAPSSVCHWHDGPARTNLSAMSPATVLRMQSGAGNRAVTDLLGAESVQRLGLGFLGDIASGMSSLLGGEDPEELQAKGGAAPATTEKPLAVSDSPVPVTILADTALEFSQKIKTALSGNPHMQPNFSWEPETDDNGKITKLNLTVKTTIVRPRYGGGRGDEREVALIRKLEGLIKAHEERHKAIALDFAAKVISAAVGKTAKTYQGAIKTVMCQMNKSQEGLDHKEGTVSWTLDPNGTRVADVALAPEPSASYPCD